MRTKGVARTCTTCDTFGAHLAPFVLRINLARALTFGATCNTFGAHVRATEGKNEGARCCTYVHEKELHVRAIGGEHVLVTDL